MRPSVGSRSNVRSSETKVLIIIIIILVLVQLLQLLLLILVVVVIGTTTTVTCNVFKKTDPPQAPAAECGAARRRC
jgi:hypothetical protein